MESARRRASQRVFSGALDGKRDVNRAEEEKDQQQREEEEEMRRMQRYLQVCVDRHPRQSVEYSISGSAAAISISLSLFAVNAAWGIWVRDMMSHAVTHRQTPLICRGGRGRAGKEESSEKESEYLINCCHGNSG